MKPTSSLSLLLFLQLASTAPIPESLFPSDCHYTSCAGFRSTLLSSKPNTPPTRLTNPNFPSHRLSSPDTLDEESFNNSPLTPTDNTVPTIALSSSRPLSSSFLLSLTNPASKPSIQKPPTSSSSSDALPSKPTSALPSLRKEDAKRYWASLRTSSKDGETLGSDGPRHKVQLCGTGESITEHYIRLQGVRLARDYSDLMVVGIVMLFLVAVVALELVERVGDLSASFCGNRRARRGEIYLEDDEEVAFIVKKPISLQADPLYYQISVAEYRDEKGGFEYDSDASEKV